MTINVRQVAPTQFLTANTSNQVLTFDSTGLLLVTVLGNTCYLATGSDELTVDASDGIPVLPNVQVLLQTGQQYNQTPGNVYVSVVGTDTADVYVTPVSV